MISSSDTQIEEEFVKNPELAFPAVFDRYSGPLLRFLYRFTGNAQASEEILQDIFVELLHDRFRSADGGSLKAWLFTVAKNRGLNHLKKSRRSVSVDTNVFASDRNLELEVIQQNLLQHLSRSEHSLPLDIQETWALRKQGLDNQQIAAALSIPLGTVKSRFSRLVEYLRKEF